MQGFSAGSKSIRIYSQYGLMGNLKTPGRSVIGPGVLAWMLLATGPAALALDPALEVSQYAHNSWKVRDGFFKESIGAIAQTPDGYLWLGTQFGLFRFDGVTPVEFKPPAGQHLPSSYIRGLLAARDGSLWIGTWLGLASWRDGKLTQHPELAGQNAGGLLEDREGTVWVGTRYPPPGKLCAFRSGGSQCYGDGAQFGDRASSLYEDHAGNLWVGAHTGLWRWKPGPPRLYPFPDIESSQGVIETDSGALLIAMRTGLKQLVNEKVVDYRLPVDGLRFQPSRVLRDRDGGIWIGTFDRGLLHVHQGKMDVYSQSDGLSGNYTRYLFEDREGNIWIATDNGLDRFRHIAVATLSVNQGLSQATPWSVLAASDGSVWVATLDGLNRLKDGNITIYRKRRSLVPRRSAGTAGALREITGEGLPHDLIQSLFEDHGRRIWVSTHAGVAYFENDRFIPVSGVPGGVHAFAGDTTGNIWISEDQSLLHVREGRVVEQIPWARLERKVPAIPMLSDPARGGLWLGFRDGTGLAYFKDAQIRASYGAAEGLGHGMVGGLHLDADGTLWAATEGGLSRLKNGRIHTLTAKNGLPCDGVNWVIEGDDHALWLYTGCGLARVPRSEVDAWAAAVEKNKDTQQKIAVTIFDNSDGVRIHAAPGGYTPQAGKSPDGRIWFLPWDGVSVIDPRRIPYNNLPPPVHVEQITADGKTLDASQGLRLPALVRDLAIDYTALCLVAPEKVRFRYKLEGQDPAWKEVLNDRRAHYSNLPPRHYRFRVAACNNSGVWNEVGDTLDFSIAPAYYQAEWFRALCAIASAAMLWGLYRLRLRQMAREFNANLEGRVDERLRIARELHDTLLQGFQGLLLRFQAVHNLLPGRPGDARKVLEGALDDAAQAITEARDAVQDLRASTLATNDLANALEALGGELAAHQSATRGDVIGFSVEVEGEQQGLDPILRDELYRIGGEALRNAFHHARARRIEVEIRYEPRRLQVRVRDDGNGIDAGVLSRGGRSGHFGLSGMRERAKRIGGQLDVWSALGAGTEVELSIPASVAFGAHGGWRFRLVTKKQGTNS